MHEYNNKETIGYNFYERPGSSKNLRLEYIFNKIYGILPITLGFSDEFEMTCLEVVQENFELLTQDLHQVGEKLLEEGIWIGKKGTIFEDSMIAVHYRTVSGGHTYDIGGDNGVGLPWLKKKQAALLQNLYVSLRVACHSSEQAKEITEKLNDYKIKQKSKIYILSNNYGELDLTALPMELQPADLALNYGPEFPEFHKKLVDNLNNTNSGLYLFYGAPGTGKSSYIKHLLGGEIERKIVYIPIGLIDRLVSPDMIPLLMENKDLILVMEDAEKALLSREESGDSLLVSSILNLTDGFIGQAMNISIIATFNTAREKIDAALLRKGRLRQSYEFVELDVPQAQALAESLGIDKARITKPMSLADIYYLDEESGYKAKAEKVVGFGA